MRVVFVKEEPTAREVKDIKKATDADVVTTDTHVCTPELQRNEYGRHETK